MDEVEIDEALTNLLENCLKYTPPATPIHISARRRVNMLEVEVADEGAGIPPAQLPQLFDRFYRVRADRQTKGVHGLGLGLSIVKGIVEAHGGKVNAANRPGGGACFTFTLPLTQKMEHG